MLRVRGEDISSLLGGEFVGSGEVGESGGGDGGVLVAEEGKPVEVVVGVGEGFGGRAGRVVELAAVGGGEDGVGERDILEGGVRGVFFRGGGFVCSGRRRNQSEVR